MNAECAALACRFDHDALTQGIENLFDAGRNVIRLIEDQVVATLLMRNAGEIESRLSIKALDPAAEDLANDLRAKAAEGVVPDIDFELFASAAVAVGGELAFRHVRSAEDVERATEFATALFLGGIERMIRKG